MTPGEYRATRAFIKPYAKLNVWLYQMSNGRLMGRLAGRDVMLVTMTGAKSGKKRTIPLMYVPWEAGVIVVASLGGAPKAPVWYRNIVANPDIEVQYRDQHMSLRARQVDDEEKARIWPTCVEYYPAFADYQARTARNIPVFVCAPR